MWTFDNPPLKHWAERYGFTPDQAALDHIRLTCVRFSSGGTGAFVGKNGLVFTNHHLVRGVVQSLSTAEYNYVEEGYYATSFESELKCPGLELNQLVSMENVTDRIYSGLAGITDPVEAVKIRDAIKAEIEKESLDATGLKSNVIKLYGGGEYWLYRFKRFTDVRLVFAAESQAANFGGDLDNFTYPRYAMDVAFVRVYENDAPYQPEHYFKWSANGASENELVLLVGNPGSTNRLYTLSQIEYMRDHYYPMVLEYQEIYLEIFDAFRQKGTEEARRVAHKISSLKNWQKASSGEYSGLLDEELIAWKAKEEADFRERIGQDRKLSEQYSDTWTVIENAVAKERKISTQRRYRSFESSLLRYARTIVMYVEEISKPDSERYPGYHDAQLPSLLDRLYSTAAVYPDMEEFIVGRGLEVAKEKLGKDDPFIIATLGRKSGQKVAKGLFGKTKLMDVDYRRSLIEGGSEAVKQSKDPLIKLARKLDPLNREMTKVYRAEIESIRTPALEKLGRAQFEIYGKSKHPDANFTLRISYGVASGYGLGTTREPFRTTIYGLYDRSASFGNQPPFDLGKHWAGKEMELDLSTPLNFVLTTDTIGGNSGSPMINTSSEIVGINFDRNIHGLTRRFIYSDKQGRSVGVHSAGILEALAKVYNADRVIEEIEASRK
jgi:hypothetical protein